MPNLLLLGAIAGGLAWYFFKDDEKKDKPSAGKTTPTTPTTPATPSIPGMPTIPGIPGGTIPGGTLPGTPGGLPGTTPQIPGGQSSPWEIPGWSSPDTAGQAIVFPDQAWLEEYAHTNEGHTIYRYTDGFGVQTVGLRLLTKSLITPTIVGAAPAAAEGIMMLNEEGEFVQIGSDGGPNAQGKINAYFWAKQKHADGFDIWVYPNIIVNSEMGPTSLIWAGKDVPPFAMAIWIPEEGEFPRLQDIAGSTAVIGPGGVMFDEDEIQS